MFPRLEPWVGRLGPLVPAPWLPLLSVPRLLSRGTVCSMWMSAFVSPLALPSSKKTSNSMELSPSPTPAGFSSTPTWRDRARGPPAPLARLPPLGQGSHCSLFQLAALCSLSRSSLVSGSVCQGGAPVGGVPPTHCLIPTSPLFTDLTWWVVEAMTKKRKNFGRPSHAHYALRGV